VVLGKLAATSPTHRHKIHFDPESLEAANNEQLIIIILEQPAVARATELNALIQSQSAAG